MKTKELIILIASLVTSSLFAQNKTESLSLQNTSNKERSVLPKFELREYHGTSDSSSISTASYTIEKDPIKDIRCKNQNILKLYQLAYGDIPENRFLFSNELSYITSSTSHNKYDLSFSGKENQLINELNSSFGLKTEKIEIDSIILILKKIETGNKIKQLKTENNKQLDNTVITTNNVIQKMNGQFTSNEIAALISKDLGYSVELNKSIENNIYDINLHVTTGRTVEERMEYFKKEGIYFEKQSKKAEYIRISK
jgi:hypothetical protein